MKRVKLDSQLQLGKALGKQEKGGKQGGKSEVKGMLHKGLGFPTRAWFCRDVTGVGELATRKRSVGLNKSTQEAIHHKTRCKETFVNGQNPAEKGQGSQPAQRKRKRRRKNPGKGNHNQDQAGPPDEGAGQRRLDDLA